MTVWNQTEFLQRTRQVAKRFAKTSIHYIEPGTTPTPLPHFSLPTLRLCLPEDLQAELDDLKVHTDMRDALMAVVSDLKNEYHRAFDQALRRVLLQPEPQLRGIEMLGVALQKRFTTQAVPKLLKQYLAEKASLAPVDQEEQRRKFNNVSPFLLLPSRYSQPLQAYIPYLKAYFDYNAYPSQHDREVMAQKSMMTSRQIEVWVSPPSPPPPPPLPP